MYDVIIIGAGISGFAAGKILNGNLNFIILEASHEIGGRLRNKTIDHKYNWDEGAHWVHDFNSNHTFYEL